MICSYCTKVARLKSIKLALLITYPPLCLDLCNRSKFNGFFFSCRVPDFSKRVCKLQTRAFVRCNVTRRRKNRDKKEKKLYILRLCINREIGMYLVIDATDLTALTLC